MRFQRKITEWKDGQSFGFVTQNGQGKRLFLHVRSFSQRGWRPEFNDGVTYAIAFDVQGWAYANQVSFVGERRKKVRTIRESGSVLPRSFARLFVVPIVGLCLLSIFRWPVLAFYVTVNLVLFIAYWLNKGAAREAARCTPESLLHLLALIGGWPGALLTQRLFRHKSGKRPFQQAYWATVALHCAGVLWLLTTYGSTVRHMLNDTIG